MAKKRNKSKTNPNSNKTECQIYIKGMHCASCELLIEKSLLKQDGVEFADASVGGAKVKIKYTDGFEPDIGQLNSEFKELGYEFSRKKFKRKADRPLISITNGQLSINPEKTKSAYKTLLIVVGFIALFFAVEKLQLGRFASVDSSSSLGGFFLLGVVASASSCAALTGGIILSLVKQWNDLYITETPIQKAKPHILFHIGRLLSFTLFGGVLGLLGNIVTLDNVTVYSVLIIVISAVMFILAMQMLEVRWAQKISISAPKFMSRSITKRDKITGKFMPAVIGAGTFFLPCGFTLIAQGVALTAGSFIAGSIIMLAFALGTLPLLAGISFSGIQMNKKPHLTAMFNKVAGLLVLFFVVYNVNSQLNVLGLPSLSDIKFEKSVTQTDNSTAKVDESGQQFLYITADGFSYTPTSSTLLKAGVPTTLVVDNKGIQGCGAFMAARGLIDGYVNLKTGINTVTFTPEAGTYKLTCTMGMVAPVTITVK